MQAMLEGYLAFARGDGGELTDADKSALDARGTARRGRASWRAV